MTIHGDIAMLKSNSQDHVAIAKVKLLGGEGLAPPGHGHGGIANNFF